MSKHAYKDHVVEREGEVDLETGETDIVEMGLKCPKCEAILAALNDGGVAKCFTCDIYWKREGDELIEVD